MNENNDVSCNPKTTLPEPALRVKFLAVAPESSVEPNQMLPLPNDVLILTSDPKSTGPPKLTLPLVVMLPFKVMLPVVLIANAARGVVAPIGPTVTLPELALMVRLCTPEVVASMGIEFKLTAE